MSLTDYKITDGDISTHGVVSQPDKLTGTAAENKAVFDALIRDAVKAKLNDLIDALVTELAGKMPAPGSYGAAGQYLQTNGDGTVTWDTPSGSGDMLRSVYDPDGNGAVDSADYATNAGTAAEAGSAASAAACTGNSATASKLATPRSLSIQDADGTNTGAGVSFDGSANKTLKLPAAIKANLNGNCSGSSGSCTGNSATASKLAAARTLYVSDSDGTNTGAGVSFDGSGNATLKLPGTIKADLAGNADTSAKLKTARNIGGAVFDGSADISLSDMGAAEAIHGHAGSDISSPALTTWGARRIYVGPTEPASPAVGDIWFKTSS